MVRPYRFCFRHRSRARTALSHTVAASITYGYSLHHSVTGLVHEPPRPVRCRLSLATAAAATTIATTTVAVAAQVVAAATATAALAAISRATALTAATLAAAAHSLAVIAAAAAAAAAAAVAAAAAIALAAAAAVALTATTVATGLVFPRCVGAVAPGRIGGGAGSDCEPSCRTLCADRPCGGTGDREAGLGDPRQQHSRR